MGFNFDIITKLITEAENKLTANNSDDVKKDGKLNTEAEISIFKNLVEKSNELSVTDKNDAMSCAEALGLILTRTNNNDDVENTGAPRLNAPRKSNTNGITINVNNSINISLNIEIDQQITNILNYNITGGNVDISSIVDALKAFLSDDASISKLQQFLVGIFKTFLKDSGLDLGELPDILKQILSQLTQQSDILNRLYNDFNTIMTQTYNALEMMGLNVSTILELVKNGNANQEDQLKLLGQIYEAIMDMKGDMKNFTETQQQQFNQIMEMLKNGNISLNEITQLLKLIKADTANNNEISEMILNEIKNGNKEIINMLNTFGGDIAQALIDIRKAIQDNTNSNKTQLEAIYNALKNLSVIGGGGGGTVTIDLSAIEQLLRDITTKTSAELEEIKNLLNQINKGVQDNSETTKQILAALNKFGPEVTSALNILLAKIEQGGTDAESIKNILAQILQQAEQNGNENNANFAKVLNAIANLVGLSGGGGGDVTINVDLSAIENILNEIAKNTSTANTKLDEMTNLLNEISKGVQKNGEISQKILDALDKFGPDVTNALTNIMTLINEGNQDTKSIEKLLDLILKQAEANGAQNEKNFQAVLIAIGNIAALGGGGGGDVTINVDLSKIEDMLEKLLNSTNNNGAKLDDMTRLLNEISQGVQKNAEISQKILDALDKLGPDVLNALADIMAVLNKSGDNIQSLKELLEKVIENQDKIDNNQNENTKKILEAIANIKIENNGTVDISSLEGMLAKLLELTEANNTLLTNIDAKLQTLNTTSEAILNKIEIECGKNDERYSTILNILNVLKGNCEKYDDSELLAKLELLASKLDEILKAIQDHKVTVDVTGTIHCDCNHDQDGSHEGVLGDLENILSAPRHNSFDDDTGIKDVKDDNNKKPVGKKFNINGKIYIRSNNKWFDPSGREVPDPTKNY